MSKEIEKALRKIRYYNMLIDCIEAAINRLDPTAPTFTDVFNELFEKHSIAVDRYNNATEEARLLGYREG